CLASTMSSRFERVSRAKIEPNEPHAHAKNVWTLNRLSLGILKNFARVSFVFIRVEILQHHSKHFYFIYQHKPNFHPFLPPLNPIQIQYNPCPHQHLHLNMKPKSIQLYL